MRGMSTVLTVMALALMALALMAVAGHASSVQYTPNTFGPNGMQGQQLTSGVPIPSGSSAPGGPDSWVLSNGMYNGAPIPYKFWARNQQGVWGCNTMGSEAAADQPCQDPVLIPDGQSMTP